MRGIIPALLLLFPILWGCDSRIGRTFKGRSQSDQKQYVLSLSHYGSPTDTITAAAEYMAERAAELSEGRIKIELFPGSRIGDSQYQLDGVRSGSIDIVCAGTPYYASFAPELRILDLPYLFEDQQKAHRVLDGPIGNDLGKILQQYNLQLLAYFEVGFRNISNNRGPIQSADDLQGLKLRTTPASSQIAAFEAWGANPFPMPLNDVYNSLRTEIIDGQENPVHHIYHNDFHKVQRYLTLTNHAYTASPMVVNLKVFNSMDEQARLDLAQAAIESSLYERSQIIVENEAGLKALRDEGVVIEEHPDIESFREGIEETWRDYTDSFGVDLILRIRTY